PRFGSDQQLDRFVTEVFAYEEEQPEVNLHKNYPTGKLPRRSMRFPYRLEKGRRCDPRGTTAASPTPTPSARDPALRSSQSDQSPLGDVWYRCHRWLSLPETKTSNRPSAALPTAG